MRDQDKSDRPSGQAEITNQAPAVRADADAGGYLVPQAATWTPLLLDFMQGGPAPRRCETDLVGLYGECLACRADCGEACQKPPDKSPDRGAGIA